MAGRGRLPRHIVEPRRPYPDDLDGPFARGPVPEGSFVRGPIPRPVLPAAVEEELEVQRRDIRRLIADNRALNDDRVGLERELLVAKDEIRRLNLVFGDFRAEKEAHIRELIEKGLKLEGELRNLEPVRAEVLQARAEIQKLDAIKQDLDMQVQTLGQDLKLAHAESKQNAVLIAEVTGTREEIMRLRPGFEFEKKRNAELVEQIQGMEKNLVSMAREIEKLRADSEGGRPWAAGGAYGMKYSNPEGPFPSSYGDGYGLHSGATDKGPLYGAGSGPWGSFDKPRLGRR